MTGTENEQNAQIAHEDKCDMCDDVDWMSADPSTLCDAHGDIYWECVTNDVIEGMD